MDIVFNCPFCGVKVELLDVRNAIITPFYYQCMECYSMIYAEIVLNTENFDDMEE